LGASIRRISVPVGGPGNDPLTGTDGNDLLDGQGGNDTLYPLAHFTGNLASWDVVDGGADFDTMIVDASGETQTVNAVQFFGPSGYQVTSTSRNYFIVADRIERVEITTGSGNDLLQGLSSNDVLRGGGGNDRLDGYYGFDILDGGTGFDTVDQRFYNGNVYVDLTVGRTNFDGTSLFDTLISIENFWAGNGHDRLRGNASDNVFVAAGGNDTLLGEGGLDTLYGGPGNDILYGGADIDALRGEADDDYLIASTGPDDLNGGPGYDTADFSFLNRKVFVDLATGREQLIPGHIHTLKSIEIVYGGTVGDLILGDGYANLLRGFGGDDVLNGRTHNDILYGGNNRDTLYGGLGHDKLYGEAHNDILYGDGGPSSSEYGVDTLYGGDGIDLLVGGRLHDDLYGGKDKDVFDFNAIADSFRGPTRDVIHDFQRGVDKIDLYHIDANTKLAGNQSFKFIGSRPFGDFLDLDHDGNRVEGAAAQLRYTSGLLQADTNGDKVPDFEIFFNFRPVLSASDFYT
jgi:Ca2+-binding RTX toxin-like protein